MTPRIEELIKDKADFNPFLFYAIPPSWVYVEGVRWTLHSTQGFKTRKEAEERLDEIDADPTIGLPKPRRIVKWKAKNRKTSKFYIYFQVK